jgi:hypothetical protein
VPPTAGSSKKPPNVTEASTGSPPLYIASVIFTTSTSAVPPAERVILVRQVKSRQVDSFKSRQSQELAKK